MNGLNPTNNPNYRIIASPLVVRDIVIAPTRERPMLAIKAGGRGDITATHRLWSFNNGPDVPTPVSDGKLLYSVTDRGVAYALDVQTGAVVYGPQRLRPDSYSASPVLVEDRIYVTSENEGLTSVYRAGPKFELLAENPLNDYCLSSPAISEGQIFIRTTGHLWAIGQRKKAQLSARLRPSKSQRAKSQAPTTAECQAPVPSPDRATGATARNLRVADGTLSSGFSSCTLHGVRISSRRLEIQHHARADRRDQKADVQHRARGGLGRVRRHRVEHVDERRAAEDQRHHVGRVCRRCGTRR